MRYDKSEIEAVNKADIRLFIQGCEENKTSQKITCPFCGKKAFSVVHKKGMNFAKCFDCGEGFPGPIKAVEYYEKLKFPQSLEYVAKVANIFIETTEEKKRKTAQQAKISSVGSFCSQQLEASGLTEEDILATVKMKDGSEQQIMPMRKGSLDRNYRPQFGVTDDDMLIFYYDLEGRPRYFTPTSRSSVSMPYIRMRAADPEAHPDKNGKERKYITPPGAQTECYITQRLRDAFLREEHIDTLFIQEGEKKAEKACKHGIMSIGIQGITNFGTGERGLLADIKAVVKRCGVKNIVLMFDSDWDNLSKSAATGDHVDNRPNSFYKTVLKFKSYGGSLHNDNLNVDVWWGHVKSDLKNEKGVDDILCGSLKGKEDELLKDIDEAMHSHDGKGKNIEVYRISSMSDKKIGDLWALNNANDFFTRHKKELSELGSFKFGRVLYKVEQDKLVKVSSSAAGREIYSVIQKENGEYKVEFEADEAIDLIEESGYCRLRSLVGDRPVYEFININEGIISYTTGAEIRNFVLDNVLKSTKNRAVIKYFRSRYSKLLSDATLEQLKSVADDFNVPEKNTQYLSYKNGRVGITSGEITPGLPLYNVWRSEIINRLFRRVKVIDDVRFQDGKWQITPTKEGAKCEFLQFLVNASNMYSRYGQEYKATEEEEKNFSQHIINKLTTIGYLLCGYKFGSEIKAVVIQDFKMSEVSKSSGGSGKSLFTMAIKKILPSVILDGKKDTRDKFYYQDVDRFTKVIAIDDVKENFNFKDLYSKITNGLSVEKKHAANLNFTTESNPKFIISTNDTIRGADQKSTIRRIIYMEFSPWYDDSFKPEDEFGHLFFDDWDEEQWSLFDNLMAECVMLYLRSQEQGWVSNGIGVVPAPKENIELRTIRQEMSEMFFQWAEEYFSEDSMHFDVALNKKDVVNSFREFADGKTFGVDNRNFTDRIKMYCRFKKYDFNVNKQNDQGLYYLDFKRAHPDDIFVGKRDSRNSNEYYTIHKPDNIK